MIPSGFVFLNVLPLSANGKVDRRALPDPGNSRPELDTLYVAPRTSVEEELARIWVEVLGIDQVGIHDNFFDLGGHSLAATRVVSRVVKAFQLKLPLKALFESPTIADMALVISQNQTKKAGQEELEHMLEEVEALSEEEAQRLVSSEPKNRNL
jgi:acyl carrier protein